jgi:hypothetical protein
LFLKIYPKKFVFQNIPPHGATGKYWRGGGRLSNHYSKPGVIQTWYIQAENEIKNFAGLSL